MKTSTKIILPNGIILNGMTIALSIRELFFSSLPLIPSILSLGLFFCFVLFNSVTLAGLISSRKSFSVNFILFLTDAIILGWFLYLLVTTAIQPISQLIALIFLIASNLFACEWLIKKIHRSDENEDGLPIIRQNRMREL